MFSHILETFSWKPGQPRYNDKKKNTFKIYRTDKYHRSIYIYIFEGEKIRNEFA